MRVIKFRVWDKDDKDMSELKGLFTYEGKPYAQYLNCEAEIGVGCEIMQFTGLADINDVKIYEGDIVKKIQSGFAEYGIVRFHHGCWMVMKNEEYFNLYHHLEKTEVIGNIHQNPELLVK